jgi:hypothetical protein
MITPQISWQSWAQPFYWTKPMNKATPATTNSTSSYYSRPFFVRPARARRPIGGPAWWPSSVAQLSGPSVSQKSAIFPLKCTQLPPIFPPLRAKPASKAGCETHKVLLRTVRPIGAPYNDTGRGIASIQSRRYTGTDVGHRALVSSLFTLGGEKSMTYTIIETRRMETEAPELTRGDLITMTEAADLMGKSIFAVRNMLDAGTLRTVIDNTTTTPHGTPKRYVLRADIEVWLASTPRKAAQKNAAGDKKHAAALRN